MAEVTIGRNSSQITSLVTSLEEKGVAINNNAQPFIEPVAVAINLAWRGPDAQDYLDKLEQSVNNLYEQTANTIQVINDNLNAIEKEWKTFQDNNKMS